MAVTGEQKGLQAVLEECGFDVLRRQAKCKKNQSACFESKNCCNARLLSVRGFREPREREKRSR